MAPTKITRPVVPSVASRGRILTRNKTSTTTITVRGEFKGKRKAEASPPKETAVKRSALGDVTNAITSQKDGVEKTKKVAIVKKVTVQSRMLPVVKQVVKPRLNGNLAPPPAVRASKIQTRASVRSNVPNETVQKPAEAKKENLVPAKVKTRLSNEFEKVEESLYSTALEEINGSMQNSSSKYMSAKSSPEKNKNVSVTMVAQELEKKLNLGNHEVPDNVVDFDQENWGDVHQVSHYAMDIFNYLKSREPLYVVRDYMDRQVCLSRWMRSLLVDWMVEIQESFELNHETLYLGVKLVDLYLSRMTVGKETLQLVGASAMFIASKFDERIPPSVNDFLYICDGAYSRKDLLKMEINILKVCNFDLGIPLSYRFLRRYARCAKVSMPILTLARFILEHSLMNYSTVTLLDSKLGAASLYLALQMKKVSGWTETLQFYTGYKLEEIASTVRLLNDDLHKKPKEQLMTVRNKYSHKIFFEVAKTPLLKNEELKP